MAFEAIAYASSATAAATAFWRTGPTQAAPPHGPAEPWGPKLQPFAFCRTVGAEASAVRVLPNHGAEASAVRVLPNRGAEASAVRGVSSQIGEART